LDGEQEEFLRVMLRSVHGRGHGNRGLYRKRRCAIVDRPMLHVALSYPLVATDSAEFDRILTS
jgi:hypothetical protein